MWPAPGRRRSGEPGERGRHERERRRKHEPPAKADAVRDCADDGRAEHDADVAHRHHPPERLRAASDVSGGAEDDGDDRREPESE